MGPNWCLDQRSKRGTNHTKLIKKCQHFYESQENFYEFNFYSFFFKMGNFYKFSLRIINGVMPSYSQCLYTYLCTSFPQIALERGLFNVIDFVAHSEKLYTGLHGGEVSNTYVRGYGQSVQAEALRCTKQKRPSGRFCVK